MVRIKFSICLATLFLSSANLTTDFNMAPSMFLFITGFSLLLSWKSAPMHLFYFCSRFSFVMIIVLVFDFMLSVQLFLFSFYKCPLYLCSAFFLSLPISHWAIHFSLACIRQIIHAVQCYIWLEKSNYLLPLNTFIKRILPNLNSCYKRQEKNSYTLFKLHRQILMKI